jgi:hypothetical protein
MIYPLIVLLRRPQSAQLQARGTTVVHLLAISHKARARKAGIRVGIKSLSR